MKLTGRTILITGGTSGIGMELARQMLDRGNTVIVTGRDAARLEAVRRELPGVHAIESDVSDPAAIRALSAEVAGRFPEMSVLINNAGIMRNLKLREGRGLEDVAREIETNLSGPVRMVQQFLPQLMSRPEGGMIANVTSGLAFVPFPASPVYSATKAAMHAYTRSLRAQMKGSAVRVVELAPPGVETPLFRTEFAEEMKGQKAMDVRVLARKAIAGIEAGKTEIRPGLSRVLGILSRVAPGLAFRQMAKISGFD